MEQLPEGFVLDEDTEAQSSALPEGFVLDSDDPMESQGIFEKGAKALQYGAAQRAVGYGKTLDAVGADSAGQTLVELGQAVAPDNYRPASQDFFDPKAKDRGLMGFGWGYAPRALLEQVPGLAADLGVGALTGGLGFVASNSAANFGPTLEARTQNDGRTMDQAELPDYLAAGAGTALNAYLNKVGVNPALNATVKGAGASALAQIPKVVGKAAVSEGLTEAGQTAVDQAATQIGTERGWDPLSAQSIKEVVGSGFLGAAAGGAIRAGRIPGDVSNSIRDMAYDPESATRVADYVKTVDEKLGNEKGEYNALKTTKQHFEGQFTQARKGANEFIKERDGGSLIAEIDNRLKHGYTLKDGDYEQLQNLFGDRGDGAALISAIKDRDTVNRLTSRGTVTDSEQRFGGGLSGGKTGRFLNPSRNIGRFLGAAAGGAHAAGQLSMPFASQLALASPMVAKLYAAQSGVYSGARAIDSVLGTSHPVRRFADRWSGVAETNTPNLPTTKDLKAAQKALQKLQAEEARSFRDAERGGSGRNSPDATRQAKQTDKAWSQHQKAQQAQEAAQDARRAEEDAAWSQHSQMPKNASEDALWAEYERMQSQESQADAEAQDGIAEGVRKMLEQTVKAGRAQNKLRQDAEAQKAADYDRGLKAKAAQDSQEARRQEEMERAWSQAGSLPKAASEDALWAQHESDRQAQEAQALEELAGMNAVEAMNRQDQMNVVAQAMNRLAQVQAQKSGDFDRGKAQVAAQDAQEAKVSQGRESEYQKAEAARRKLSPEALKARQEEEAWSQYEQDQDEDWNDADAEKAIQAELKKRESESKRTVDQSKKAKEALEKLKKKAEEGASNPKPGEMPDVQPKGNKKLSDKALEKVQAAQAIETDGDFYVTKRGVQEARIPKDEITHSPGRWANRTQQRFEVRERFANDLSKLGGSSFKDATTTLLSRLSNRAKSWDEAYGYIEEFVNEPKHEKLANDIWDVFNKHLGELEGTYE